jgi:hypothetical protein
MKRYSFQSMNYKSGRGNQIFAVTGEEIEVLENLWVKLLGREYDPKKRFGMRRDGNNNEVRTFEDASGLLGTDSGEIIVDLEKETIVINSLFLKTWLPQIDLIPEPLRAYLSDDILKRILALKNNAPVVLDFQ